LGSSLAKLWNDDLGYVKANAQASNGGIDNLNLLQSGEAQVSMAVTSIMYQSYNGEAVFEGRPNEKLRVLSGLYYNPNQVVVRRETGIDSLKDIAGENIDTLKQSNSALKDMKIEDAVTDLAGLPLHDGAIKYYKEMGLDF